MSDLMREEFEAACEARFNWSLQDPYRDESERTLSTWDGESYRNRIVQGMWWAWQASQASRKCLVIELPADAHLSRDGLDEHYLAGDMRDQIVESIHAAGVKTK